MWQITLTCATLAGLSGAALAEGCALDGGVAEPRIEAFNQMMLDREFDAFATTLESMANMNVEGAMQSVSEAYAEGFDGCTTIAQRRDTGGMTQNLVMFHGKAGPLFVYWLYAGSEDQFKLLQFNLDSDLDLLDSLR